MIYTLATGLTQGSRAAIAAAFGCTIGILPSLLAALFGLAAILYSSALAFQIVKFAGVAFLLYLAWQNLKDSSTLQVDTDQPTARPIRIAINGALINVLNPKLALFFMAFLPQFLSGVPSTASTEMLSMGAVFMAMTFVVFVGYGVCAATARDRVLSNPGILRWLRRGFSASFAGLAAKLAFERT